MIRLLLVLVFLFIYDGGFCQKLYPLLENDIKFCYHCDNEFDVDFDLVDRVWEYENEIYTKIKSEDLLFELFKLTDTTYHFRKYKEDDLIERGDVLLRKDNIVFKDTLYVHSHSSHEEYFVVYGFVKPIKINRWEIKEGFQTDSYGEFDDENNKKGFWTYKTCDTTLIKNHETNDFYYIKPQAEIVLRNIDWLHNKFHSKIFKSKFNEVEGAIQQIDHQYTTDDEWNFAYEKNFYKFSVEFKPNGEVLVETRDDAGTIFTETLNWKINEFKMIEITNKNNNRVDYQIDRFGENFILLSKLKKKNP